MMFNENKEFYPTPKKLIEKMFAGVDLKRVKTILEPSAGIGNIADYLQDKKESETWGRYAYSIDCIEKEKNFQAILRSKKYRVIYDDFLAFNTFKEYDLIVMNPPFSDGDKHLLKALEMQERTGGAIICLLNAETLRNPYSVYRKLLLQKLDEYNAEIEYIPNAFCNADRKTYVEIALIKCQLPEKTYKSFILDNLQKAEKNSLKQRIHMMDS